MRLGAGSKPHEQALSRRLADDAERKRGSLSPLKVGETRKSESSPEGPNNGCRTEEPRCEAIKDPDRLRGTDQRPQFGVILGLLLRVRRDAYRPRLFAVSSDEITLTTVRCRYRYARWDKSGSPTAAAAERSIHPSRGSRS